MRINMTNPTGLPGAVLFDMDGTLTDTEKLWFEAETEVLADLGRSWKAGDEMAVIGLNLLDASRYLTTSLDLELEPAELARRLTDRVVAIGRQKGMPWRPGALELLELVAHLGIPSALVTASHMPFAQLALEQAPVGTLSVVVTGDQVENGKPHPQPYLEAISRLGIPAYRAVAFEDSIHGVTSAVAAGAVVVGVPLKVDISGVANITLVDSLSDVDEYFLSAVMTTTEAPPAIS